MPDIGLLYGRLAERLADNVRVNVRAPESVVEDACQFAWSQLAGRGEAVEFALSWLTTTARREAVRLVRLDQREMPLQDGAIELEGPPLEDVVERRARLAELKRLSELQQRLMWLRGLGFSYAEMAAGTGCTERSVERQLKRARRTMEAG